MTNDEIIRLVLQIVGAKDLDEAKAAAERLHVALEKTDSSTRSMGRAALESGRILQDFAQGGVGGVLNNIEGLSLALGGGPGLAGLLTGVGLAAFFAKPYLEEWVKSLGPMKEEIPKATDRLQAMTDAIKKDKEALEDLRKQESLGYFEMQKYNDLVAKVTRSEQELAMARKARSVGPGDTKEHGARGGAFREALAQYGGGEKLIDALTSAGLTQKEAEELISDALAGTRGAAERIQRETAGAAPNTQFGWVSPETARRRQLQGQQTENILKRNAEQVRERQQEADRLNREGIQNEKAMDRQREAQERADARQREQEVRGDVNLARRIGRAAVQQEAPERPDLGQKLPLIPMNASPDQAMQIMERSTDILLENQAKLSDFKARMEAKVQILERIKRGIEQTPAPTGLPR